MTIAVNEAQPGASVQVQEPAPTQSVAKLKTKGTGDYIADTAQEVENLTKTKALNLADSLADGIEANYFKLGGVLKVINENTWFEGFESFDSFVYEKYGFQSRKARYLMQIYSDLVNNHIPWDKVSHLGWTKLKDLSPMLTLDNLDEWIEKANALKVTDLQAVLKAATPGSPPGEPTTDEVVPMKFKLKPDQAQTVQHALAKARGEIGTDYDTVALENICALYLSGGLGTAPAGQLPDLKAVFQSAGWETVLNTFGEVFPSIDISVQVPEDAAGNG